MGRESKEVVGMKIKVTEIEATAEELRQSNTMADALTRMIRNSFSPYCFCGSEDESDMEESE